MSSSLRLIFINGLSSSQRLIHLNGSSSSQRLISFPGAQFRSHLPISSSFEPLNHLLFVAMLWTKIYWLLAFFLVVPRRMVSGASLADLDYPSLLRILQDPQGCALMEDRAMWLAWRSSNAWTACLAIRKWRRVDLAMVGLAQQCHLQPIKAVIDVFIHKGKIDDADKQEFLARAFCQAVHSECLPVAKYLLEQGADIRGIVGDEDPFLVAIDQGNLEMIVWLADQGANWYAPEYHPSMDPPPENEGDFRIHWCYVSRSPLDRAAFYEHLDVVRWLVLKDSPRTIRPLTLACAALTTNVQVLEWLEQALRGLSPSPHFWLALEAAMKLDKVDAYHRIVPAHLPFEESMLVHAVQQDAKHIVAAMISTLENAAPHVVPTFLIVAALRHAISPEMFCICATVLPWKSVAWLYPHVAIQSMDMLRMGLDPQETARCLEGAHTILSSNLVHWPSSRGLLHGNSLQNMFANLLDSPYLLYLAKSVPIARALVQHGLSLDALQSRYDLLIERILAEPQFPKMLLNVQSEREVLLLLQVDVGVQWKSEHVPLLFFRMLRDGYTVLLDTLKGQGFDVNDPVARLLQHAAEFGFASAVEYLLDQGAASQAAVEEAFTLAATRHRLLTCRVLMRKRGGEDVISPTFIIDRWPTWPPFVRRALVGELQRLGHQVPAQFLQGGAGIPSDIWQWLARRGY